MMNQELQGRAALVCGASKGIGRASALALAERGAAVTVLARNGEALEALLPELRAAGASAARALVADLEDQAALAASVDALLEAEGSQHILLNNTGGPPPGLLLEAEPEDFLKALSRHLLASHLLVRKLVPGMAAAGYGRIVNVISTSVREPLPRLGVSNTTRGAMAAWAKTLARELPPGVTINSVLPGFTDTERLSSLAATLAAQQGVEAAEVFTTWRGMVPEGRLGTAAELGAVVAFLVSPAAAYVRGVCLPVDGGRLNSI